MFPVHPTPLPNNLIGIVFKTALLHPWLCTDSSLWATCPSGTPAKNHMLGIVFHCLTTPWPFVVSKWKHTFTLLYLSISSIRTQVSQRQRHYFLSYFIIEAFTKFLLCIFSCQPIPSPCPVCLTWSCSSQGQKLTLTHCLAQLPAYSKWWRHFCWLV